jgi:polyhydroxyalkanoate synthase
MILWLTPRAALPVLKTVLLPGSVSGRQLHDVTAEIEALGTESVERTVEAAIAHRVECYLAGLEAYRRHRFRRHSVSRPVVWHEGTTRLLDYGRDARGPIVLVIPSLINRYYVLDLLPEWSFLQHLANSGLRPLVIDWQAPGSQERHFDLADYIDGRLEAAFAALRRIADGPIAVVGYCMGGLLSLALALRRLRARPKRLQQHSSQRQSCDHRSVTSA